MKCKNCNGDIELVSTFCGYCDAAVVKMPSNVPDVSVHQGTTTLLTANMAGLPPYYVAAFAEIDAGGWQKSPWNWAAFLCGVFWYFYRGLWAKGMLLLLVSGITGGAAWFFLIFS